MLSIILSRIFLSFCMTAYVHGLGLICLGFEIEYLQEYLLATQKKREMRQMS